LGEVNLNGIVDFVLENGNIRAVLEDIPTQSKRLSLMERKILETGNSPVYVDVIKFMKILEYLRDRGPSSKKDISRMPNLSKSFKNEVKKYYQSPLSELCQYGLIRMVGKSRRYTSYELTESGSKAIEDYEVSKGAPMLGTNFNKDGEWLIPLEAYIDSI
jgi:predicted transcriptional regulator